jgi:hypothetical protein
MSRAGQRQPRRGQGQSLAADFWCIGEWCIGAHWRNGRPAACGIPSVDRRAERAVSLAGPRTSRAAKSAPADQLPIAQIFEQQRCRRHGFLFGFEQFRAADREHGDRLQQVAELIHGRNVER